jgi:hypothetical protein
MRTNAHEDLLTVGILKLLKQLFIGGTEVTASAAELNIMDGVTADKNEINTLDGVTAGVASASKAVVLGATKNLDTLVVADNGLKLGGTAITKTATEINALVGGVAGGYKVARGVAAVTGTETVVTGLTTVVAVIATPQSDLDGDALAGISATIGDQAGSPAAGSIILKCWKSNGDGDATLVAATAAKDVNWIAIGV